MQRVVLARVLPQAKIRFMCRRKAEEIAPPDSVDDKPPLDPHDCIQLLHSRGNEVANPDMSVIIIVSRLPIKRAAIRTCVTDRQIAYRQTRELRQRDGRALGQSSHCEAHAKYLVRRLARGHPKLDWIEADLEPK